MGASAGGVHALSEVISSLPADLPAAVFAVLHLNPFGRSALPAILNRRSVLPVKSPEDGEPVLPGNVYVASPDWHLAFDDGRIRLSHGPTENGHRPAADVLFRTAARSYGPRVVGVVLTGNLDDGTAGLMAVKQHGGIAVVQDPDEADYSGMPASALRNVAVDHVLPLDSIGPLLERLAREPAPNPDDAPDPSTGTERSQGMRWEPEWEVEPGEVPSGLTCPDCGGALWMSSSEGLHHFRCRTGHAYSPESLAAKQSSSLEAALWAALRSLEENASLARSMAQRFEEKGAARSRGRYLEKAQAAEKHAAQIRSVIYDQTRDHELREVPPD
jgi:two-component system chemotaxis response regulator CheB